MSEVVMSRRLVAAGAAVVVLVGVVFGMSRLGPGDSGAAAGADLTAEPFKTATVATGDLAVSDRLEGTLQRTSELVVVHRISGATPGTGSGLTTGVVSTGAAPAGGGGAGLTAWFRPALMAQDLTCESTSSTTSTTDSSTTSSSTTETSITVGPDSTTTTAASDPCAPATTSTTVPTPSTGGPGGSLPAGGGAPSGSAPSGGAAPAAGTSSPTQQATSTPTEMITSLLSAGTAVQSGDVLYSVEGRPVVALTGSVPAWRDLASGIDDGADVAQLEAALTALGYSDGGKLTVDEAWDSRTTAAVKAWQTGLGLESTGEVPLGYVVFVPADTTVTAVNTGVGAKVADGDAVLRLATPSQQLVASVPAELRPVVAPGLAVEVSGVAATVTRLGSSTGSDGTVGVVAYITPSGPIAAADGSSVSARFTVTDAAGVLLVPVDAVTSRIDGSYAVLAVDDTGRSGTWVPIEIHGVADGKVAATGDGLHDGLVVAVPGDVATAATAQPGSSTTTAS